MKSVLAVLLVVLVLLQVRLWTGPGSLTDIARLENAIEEQSDENAGLEARNSELMDEVSDLRNGLDSIEERARNELGLIRRGETFYLIVENDGTTSPPADTADAPALTAQPPAEPVLAPPEHVNEENPYLEMFRDEQGAPAQAADAQTPDAGQAAGQ